MIDLEEVVLDKILNQKICEVSERWGCFRVMNYGVLLFLMFDMKKIIMDFFECLYEVKVCNIDVLLGIGYRVLYDINFYYEIFGFYDMVFF